MNFGLLDQQLPTWGSWVLEIMMVAVEVCEQLYIFQKI